MNEREEDGQREEDDDALPSVHHKQKREDHGREKSNEENSRMIGGRLWLLRVKKSELDMIWKEKEITETYPIYREPPGKRKEIEDLRLQYLREVDNELGSQCC